MTPSQKPDRRPENPRFSSGPCTKHPPLAGLPGALLGRNHRGPETKARLEFALLKTRELLEMLHWSTVASASMLPCAVAVKTGVGGAVMPAAVLQAVAP